jgi:hypothetical protein
MAEVAELTRQLRKRHKSILFATVSLVELKLSVENSGASRVREFEMARILRSADHGLLAAGVVLLATYLFLISLKGTDAFYEAVHPLALSTYLILLLPLAPGAFFLWLSDQLSPSQ